MNEWDDLPVETRLTMRLARPIKDGPWQVVLWGQPNRKFWCIFNLETEHFEEIGRVSRGTGVNHYDGAHKEAEKRNKALKAKAARYEVQHYTLCEGWVNTWSTEDGPLTFASVEEAQAELDDYIAETVQAYQDGDLGAPYTYDEFRIKEVGE